MRRRCRVHQAKSMAGTGTIDCECLQEMQVAPFILSIVQNCTIRSARPLKPRTTGTDSNSKQSDPRFIDAYPTAETGRLSESFTRYCLRVATYLQSKDGRSDISGQEAPLHQWPQPQSSGDTRTSDLWLYHTSTNRCINQRAWVQARLRDSDLPVQSRRRHRRPHPASA